jgi:ABC-2 type transport system ATP-binding protein
MSNNLPLAYPIEVRNLTKYYGSFLAVDSVSFRVSRGEIVGFLGPNGAGKSTIMKILTCYMSATEGEISVAGYDGYTEALAVRREVGYQPENVPIYDEMVVADYLLFMAKMRGVARSNRSARVVHVAGICGLRDVMGKLVRELSKGYRQRVGLAQALIHDPSVIILDEPMSGLDPNQIIEIRDLIREIGKKKTVIFSSHILQEIEKICDRVLIIDHGKIVADGTVTELIDNLDGCDSLEEVFRALTGRKGETKPVPKKAGPSKGLEEEVEAEAVA